jgi:hypothetical protein
MAKLFPLPILLFLCVFQAHAQSLDNNDVQFWNETQLVFPILRKKDDTGRSFEKVIFFINGNLRFGGNISRFADERAGFGINYRHNEYLSFTPSYIYIARQSRPGQRAYESRVRFAVNLENKWKKLTLNDRNLVEYRFRIGTADSVQYRNKIKLGYSITRNDKEIIAPFVADEVFYDFREKAFTRNELSFGVTRKLYPNTSADFFYLWQVNESGTTKHVNAIGVNLKIHVGRPR